MNILKIVLLVVTIGVSIFSSTIVLYRFWYMTSDFLNLSPDPKPYQKINRKKNKFKDYVLSYPKTCNYILSMFFLRYGNIGESFTLAGFAATDIVLVVTYLVFTCATCCSSFFFLR